MKLLGIDYGDAKVGLAIGDTESGFASPYKILKNTGRNNLLNELNDICQKEKVETIVIGLPESEVQSPEQLERVKDFITQLELAVAVPIITQDERFTTLQAQKLSRGSKKHEDDIAAMLILQGYLDSKI